MVRESLTVILVAGVIVGGHSRIHDKNTRFSHSVRLGTSKNRTLVRKREKAEARKSGGLPMQHPGGFSMLFQYVLVFELCPHVCCGQCVRKSGAPSCACSPRVFTELFGGGGELGRHELNEAKTLVGRNYINAAVVGRGAATCKGSRLARGNSGEFLFGSKINQLFAAS